ncbi:MAG: hypothetical protein IPK26_10720 [Planctomycetes bacterium]|nr:hypothetical protein [Planctomycetota bacterium]
MTSQPTSPPPPPPPREPEIELLGRIARRFLWLVRRVLWLAGVAAIAHDIWRSGVNSGWSLVAPASLVSWPAATGIAWLCLGTPLFVRIGRSLSPPRG